MLRAIGWRVIEIWDCELKGDPPGVAPTYYKLRSNERVLPADAIWYEALRPLLFQIGDPTAISVGKALSRA